MRYLVLTFMLLTMSAQAQFLDTITKGTPLYPGWSDKINILINSHNVYGITEDREKERILTRPNGYLYIYIDSARGNDNNTGASFLDPVKTMSGAFSKIPINTTKYINLIFAPGTYSEHFNKDLIAPIAIHIIDSLEYEYWRANSATALSGLDVDHSPITFITSDALAAGIDTTNWNPFAKQGPVTITEYFRLMSTSHVTFHTYYHFGYYTWRALNKTGRLVFRQRIQWPTIIDAPYIGHQRSHITVDMRNLPNSTGAFLIFSLASHEAWIGGFYFQQDSAKANNANLPAFGFHPKAVEFRGTTHIPLDNPPGGKSTYFQNVRRVANFYTYNLLSGQNTISYILNNSGYNYSNPLYTKGEIYLATGWNGTLVTDTTRSTVLVGTAADYSISYNSGSTFYSTKPASQFLTNDLLGSTKLRGTVTIGAGDSVRTTLTGVLPTDFINLTYQGGVTPTKALSWEVNAANILTIYGDATRVVNYWRVK